MLGWPAPQTADALGLTVAAVESALQRARAILRERLPRERLHWATPAAATAHERMVLARYIQAQREGDWQALAALLAENLRVEFPPLPLWVEGRQSYLDGIRDNADAGEYQLIETMANHQPAVAVYLRTPGSERFRCVPCRYCAWSENGSWRSSTSTRRACLIPFPRSYRQNWHDY